MTGDFDKTLREIKAKRGSGRKTHGLYLKTSIVQAFKKLCDSHELSASEVIEHWMAQAIEKAEKKKK